MKNFAFLIESELEKAEVVLAAKAVTDAIQKMAETVAKMEADDVMPLNDPIREYFGVEAASKFAQAVSGKLRELTQHLSDTKNAISDEIARMQGEMDGIPQDDLSNMDADDAAAPAPEGEVGDLGDMEIPADGEDAPADAAPADAPPAEEPRFDDDAMGDINAAGRPRKESVARNKPMLEGSNPDRAIARDYAGLIREGHDANVAARTITETYGITVKALIDIVSTSRKK